MKRILAGIMIFCMLLLTGCGESGTLRVEKVQLFEDDGSGSSGSQAGVAALWKASHLSLDSRFENAVVKNGTVYGYYTDDSGVTVVAQDIQSGKVVSERTISGADSAESITVDQEGTVYVLGSQNGSYVFWKVDQDGKISSMGDFELEDLDDEHTPVPRGLYIDDSGYYYLWYQVVLPASEFYDYMDADVVTDADRIYVKDSNLNTVMYEQVPDSQGNKLLGFSFGSDGSPTILAKDRDGSYLLTMDIDTGESTEYRIDGLEALSDADSIAVTENGILYCQGSGLYEYNMEEQTIEKKLDLSSFGISASDIIYLGMDGESIEIIDNYGSTSASEYTLLEEGENTATILTLGVTWETDEIAEMVTGFNRFHDDVQITIVDYSASADSVDDGIEQLKLDIISGEAPDILEVSGIDYEILADKGVFADLYDFMEGDSECGKSSLLTDVLSLYEMDGHLYLIAPAFQIYSMWGSSSSTQGKVGVTLSELEQILKANGRDLNAVYGFSVDEPVLTTLCAMAMDEFIDWENGTCDFETEAFQEVLDFANAYTGGYEGTLSTGIANGNVMMTVGTVFSVANYQLQKELYGGSLNYIGYPTQSGSGTAIGFHGGELAINAKSENMDVAWEFVKYYILNGYDGNGFPVVSEQFDEVMTAAMTDDLVTDNGVEYAMAKATYYDDNTYIEVMAATEQDVSAVKSLIAQADRRFGYHTEIQNIINEEAAYYFAGQKSFADVASVIQNRVQLYLAED